MSAKLPDDAVKVTYVWIDGSGEHVRSKTRTMSTVPMSPKDCPIWNFDGSSTGQAEGNNSDVDLLPVALYNDPIRGGNSKLVMCECKTSNGKPAKGNFRYSCLEAMDKVDRDFEPWFAIEQEFILLDLDDYPLGWPKGGFPGPQGPYYCGVGAGRIVARKIIEAHYTACLQAGIPISGTNAEVLLGQWEFQVGPSRGVAIGDDLWMARYLLHSIAEEVDIKVSFDPKPVPGNWNGSGAHTNFSTKQTRAKDGLKVIEEYIESLRVNHSKHIGKYDPRGGADNARRLTGLHETSSINTFSAGVANRGASVRIPRSVATDGCGYLEDRRPASNVDPYVVSEALVRTCCLKE